MNEKLIGLFPYTRTRLWVVAVVVVSPYFTAGWGTTLFFLTKAASHVTNRYLKWRIRTDTTGGKKSM
jgi:hypothetical protein